MNEPCARHSNIHLYVTTQIVTSLLINLGVDVWMWLKVLLTGSEQCESSSKDYCDAGKHGTAPLIVAMHPPFPRQIAKPSFDEEMHIIITPTRLLAGFICMNCVEGKTRSP